MIIGIAADGVLAAGRLPWGGNIDYPPIAGRLAKLLDLLPLYEIAIAPLWPARGVTEFLACWLDHHLRMVAEIREHPEPALALLTALHRIDVAERLPDHLDAVVMPTAVGWWEGDPLEPAAIATAIERGRALSRLAA